MVMKKDACSTFLYLGLISHLFEPKNVNALQRLSLCVVRTRDHDSICIYILVHHPRQWDWPLYAGLCWRPGSFKGQFDCWSSSWTSTSNFLQSRIPCIWTLRPANGSTLWSPTTTPPTWWILPRNTTPAYYPMHLHGHEFAILAQGDGPFTKDIVPNLSNPARRDVATVAHGGHLWIVFQVNNPGAWLFHCHIAGHLKSGLALQYIEQPRKIKGLMGKAGDGDGLLDRCESWSQWSRDKNFFS